MSKPPFDAHDEPEIIPGVIASPGAGPVRGGTFEDAEQNMAAFCRDLEEPPERVDFDPVPGPFFYDFVKDCGDGRFQFMLQANGREAEIDMPGLATQFVRYLKEPDQGVWYFPRLYVNGSSWVWLYALHSAAHALTTDEED